MLSGVWYHFYDLKNVKNTKRNPPPPPPPPPVTLLTEKTFEIL